jgi:hypothetical protein
MANIYLSPSFIETQRAKGISNDVLAGFIGRAVGSTLPIQSELEQVKMKYGAKNEEAIKRYLDWKVYGTSNPTERFVPEQEQKPEPSTASKLIGGLSLGVLGRGETGGGLVESIKSVPERAMRGFGSKETREGRTETSKGFDIADIPGDLADVIGPALPLIGGILGGTVTAPASLTGVGIPITMAGAAAGAGAMEGGRRMIGDLMGVDERYSGKAADFSPTGEVMKGVGVEALTNAAGELGGQLLVKGVTKLAAPFAKQFMGDVAEMAARQGVRLPASAMTKSNVVRTGEAIASKGFFGGSVGEISEQASKDIAKLGDDFVASMGGADDLLLAGKSIDEGAQTYRKAWQQTKAKLYNKASELIQARPKKEFIDVSEPVAVLENILKSKAMAGEVLEGGVNTSRLSTILKNLKNKKLSIGILESTSNELGQIIKDGGLVKTGDEAALASVQKAIQNALESHVAKFAPEVAEALAKADKAYKTGIQLLDSNVGNQIDALADTPERIVDAIIKPNSESSVTQLLNLVGRGTKGAQRVANVKTAFAKRLLDSAKNQDGMFAGEKLGAAIKKYGRPTMEAVFGKDAAAQLDEIAKLSHAMTSGEKIAQGSQTAFIAKIGSVISGASAAVMSGRPDLALGIILGGAGSDYAMMKLFATDAGRKLLLEGYKMQLERGIPNAAQGMTQMIQSASSDQ